jgi:hypothetical protein
LKINIPVGDWSRIYGIIFHSQNKNSQTSFVLYADFPWVIRRN